MSHDVAVSCHTCGNALNYGHESLPYGLKGLFADLGAPVTEWNGKSGVEVLPALQHAVAELEDAIQRQWWRAKHDDEPGVGDWSRVDFALPFLRAMRDGCCRDPWAVIHV